MNCVRCHRYPMDNTSGLCIDCIRATPKEPVTHVDRPAFKLDLTPLLQPIDFVGEIVFPSMSESKATNPKEAFGSAKAPLSCVPTPVMYEVGLAMLEGALKYGRHNYRVSGVRISTYYDAVMRHITAWWEGQDIDPESGLPHIVKAIACLAVIRDAEMLGLVNDDRPPSHPDGWQEKYKAAVADLKDRYPNPKEPFLRDSPPAAEK